MERKKSDEETKKKRRKGGGENQRFMYQSANTGVPKYILVSTPPYPAFNKPSVPSPFVPIKKGTEGRNEVAWE
jgi:hypothetical protein